MKEKEQQNEKPKHAAVLVKAATGQQESPPVIQQHPDRALYEKLIGLRWAELRAYYNEILGHPPKCKNCGHIL